MRHIYKLFSICGLLVILSFFSCSSFRQLQKVDDNSVLIFPPPPNEPRIQFLTKISSSVDITGAQSRFKKYIMGKEKVRSIDKPYGIAAYKGKIYICDTNLNSIEIIDLKKNKFEQFEPKGMGKLNKPINCFVDQNGFLYVADVGRQQVVVFDENSNYLYSIGSTQEMRPTDVFVYDDKVWIVDIKNHKIKVYSKINRKLILSFPETDESNKEYLYSPTNISIVNDQVYVSDIGDSKIKIYSTDGTFLKSVGSYGNKLGQFVRPKGIALDQESNLYVIDSGFENAQVFNSDGKLLMFFGGKYIGPGYMWLPAKIIIDYNNLEYFQKYVHNGFNLKYLIFVTNQYGPDKINVYGFVESKSS